MDNSGAIDFWWSHALISDVRRLTWLLCSVHAACCLRFVNWMARYISLILFHHILRRLTQDNTFASVACSHSMAICCHSLDNYQQGAMTCRTLVRAR